jgi:hypothetical protein
MQIIRLSKYASIYVHIDVQRRNPGTNPLYSFHKGQKCNKTFSISKNGSL